MLPGDLRARPSCPDSPGAGRHQRGQVTARNVAGMVREGAAMFDELFAQVKELLIAFEIAHADETGLWVEAQSLRIHAVSDLDLFLYQRDAGRGAGAMDPMGVGSHLHGLFVYDGWAR